MQAFFELLLPCSILIRKSTVLELDSAIEISIAIMPYKPVPMVTTFNVYCEYSSYKLSYFIS